MRTCEVCGKEIHAGMTNGEDMCVCEDCFEQYMDEMYGKHQWMEVNDDGCDGYYIVSMFSVVGGYMGTGIYYTEWEEDE